MQFRSTYYFLSNMYPCSVTVHTRDSIVRTYKCSESAYQACKCYQDSEKFVALDGYSAKKLGRQLPMIPNWDQIKVDIMFGVVKLKFKQHPELLEQLRQIKGDICEDITWHDTFWGVYKGYGQNHLGHILMRIRDMEEL